MTVKELIAKLEKLNQSKEIKICTCVETFDFYGFEVFENTDYINLVLVFTGVHNC